MTTTAQTKITMMMLGLFRRPTTILYHHHPISGAVAM